MSQFDDIFNDLSNNPSSGSLGCFAEHVEAIAKTLPSEQVKTGLMACIRSILHLDKFASVRQDESMLRLYKLMCRASTKLGGPGIYEQLNRKGLFTGTIKFYLQWAEECCRVKELDKFGKVLNLARERLSGEMSTTDIESGFRDLADDYFSPDDVQHLFLNPDDTLNMFEMGPRMSMNGKKPKRRSSVVFLRQYAPVSLSGSNAFGPNTITNIRSEFIESNGCFGCSIEEFRYAKWRDGCGEDAHGMDEKRRDSGIVTTKHQATENDQKAREAVEGRLKKRMLSTHMEDVEEEDEKRSRHLSPLVPTKDAHRPPLRNSNVNQKVPSTITLSSDTNTSLNQSDRTLEDNEKLRLMSAGKKEGKRTLSTSSNYSTISTRTAKSASGLDLMAENNCQEAHAMFSDTVHLGNEKTMVLNDDSDIVETVPSSNTAMPPPVNVTTDFSVLCDPDPTMHVPNDRPKKTSNGLNVVYDEQQPAEGEEVEAKTALPKEDPSLTTPTSFQDQDMFDEEPIRKDFANRMQRNIVTSTPAGCIPFMDVEEYFGNKEVESSKDAEPTFMPPSSSTLHRLMRRKSQAASTFAAAPPKQPVQPAVQNNTSIDALSDNLGRRLSIGADDILNAIEDAAETTGCKNRRRSEVIRGDMNPWDENVRKMLMSLVRPPTNMHEFAARCPKLLAMRDLEAGGEKFRIQTIIGQGGYAKVYRAVNEEEKTVAVKYEVPGCAWEVYICDQMRNRLLRENNEDKVRVADWCIMQVMDAYVFSNASLLVNEYHEYGTLLELANNMKDPNWHVLGFIMTQMAHILKEVHACKIIHGDIKPDNFIITRKIDSSWGKDDLLNTDAFVIKLIDWGRAIDMMPLPGKTFSGRAGTEGFDSPEMIDGRPWTYQTDFFGYAASIVVLASGKYPILKGSGLGNYTLTADIKRRNILRDVINSTIDTFLNISSCAQLPDWNETIALFSGVWNDNFEMSAWRQSVAKFNEACELASSTKT